MKRYLASQVVTAKQLKIGDIMHCGQLSGQCVEWKCVANDGKVATVAVGGSVMKMTSSDIRSGLPMFYAHECPMCQFQAPLPAREPAAYNESPNFVAVDLEAADVPSALSGVENYRRGGMNQGGAAISNQRRYFDKKALDLAARILAAQRSQGTAN